MNIAVIYGGTSCERDVSVITGIQAMGMLDTFKYDIFPVLISEDGDMLMPKNAGKIRTYIGEKVVGTPVHFEGEHLVFRRGMRHERVHIDCALLCTHGGMGENGALQGFLEMCRIPYTSPGVEPSAICMNKITAKSIFLGLGINVLDGAKVQKGGGKQAAEYAAEVGYPVIVKPAGQGSSIGIDMAKDKEQLMQALDMAFEFDDTVLVEKALTDFKEINCACVRSRGEVIVSSPERPICWREFLTFEDKYLSNGKGKMSASAREFPAILPKDAEEYVKSSAARVYAELDMKGVVRFDFLMDNASGKVYLNEANTIPGSLASYLFTDKGIDGNRLMDIMIEEAVTAKGEKRRIYSSKVLEAYGTGSANACKIAGGHI